MSAIKCWCQREKGGEEDEAAGRFWEGLVRQACRGFVVYEHQYIF